ncbi:MAG: hypothetical protein ACOY90_14430 [Candidatus Zhuqueibacterota bacterium]
MADVRSCHQAVWKVDDFKRRVYNKVNFYKLISCDRIQLNKKLPLRIPEKQFTCPHFTPAFLPLQVDCSYG